MIRYNAAIVTVLYRVFSYSSTYLFERPPLLFAECCVGETEQQRIDLATILPQQN